MKILQADSLELNANKRYWQIPLDEESMTDNIQPAIWKVSVHKVAIWKTFSTRGFPQDDQSKF